MQAKTETKPSLGKLAYLPSFAQYLLQHRIDDLVNVQIRISNEVAPPLLDFFRSLPEETLREIARKGLTELLTCLSKNEGCDYIETSLQQWKTNQLPVIDRKDISAEDITQITYIRKKAFLSFVADYTTEVDELVELVKELDYFLMESQTASTKVYLQLLHEQIHDHSNFIEKITNTSPGIIYVYDVIHNRELYANRATSDYLGYTAEEMTAFGQELTPTLIHPDDLPLLRQYEEEFRSIRDGEVRSFKYRFKTRSGEYRWMRTYETVFRRNAVGAVSEKIGIAIDVHQQKITADALQKREAELLEAQEIAQLGNFIWDLAGKESSGSEQVTRILEVPFDDHEGFMHRVHPADKKKVEEAIAEALQTGKLETEYRYQGDQGEKVIWCKGKVNYREGKPASIHGTLMDITERSHLVEQLKMTESMYRRSEVLSDMGNWSYDLKSHTLQWTDHLYRIYGIEPQAETITVDKFLSYVHPEDRAKVIAAKEQLFNEQKVEHTFRILVDGQTKIIRSIAQLELDAHGEPFRIVGTERNVTEKHNLITNLVHNETLYKQAQALAHVGNYTWDMESGRITWSDELYRIFGLEPQSEEIDYDKYISFIHPADRKQAIGLMQEAAVQKQQRSTIHKIVRRDGSERYIQSTGEVTIDAKGKKQMLGTAQDVTEKQELIEKLQQSEKLYKQAQLLAGLGNWTWDILQNKIQWSEEVYRIYELPVSEVMTYDKIISFVHPDDKERVIAGLEKSLQTGSTYDLSHRIVLSSGKVKTIYRRAEVVMSEGTAVKMVGTTQDVTEEHRVQQELRDNQNFIRKITDATPSIIASYNTHTGHYVFINEGLQKLLGYPSSAVMEQGAKFFSAIIHPDEREEIAFKTRSFLDEANAHPDKHDLLMECNYRMLHSNGSYRWFHTYCTVFDRNAENKVEHLLDITLDVTEQKEAAQKIIEQEHFIQQIADASPTILYLYDVDTQSIVYINREIFFVLGYLPDEVLEAGAGITELLYHPDDYQHLPGRRQSQKNFQQVDSMMQYECRMRNKDEEWRWFLVREIVFKTDEKGSIKQILGAALDINRRKDMERTILQNTLQLEQSNASLEEFAYVASHDLKEPLRKISTFGDRLIASHADNLAPEGKVYLKKIIDASQRMQTMISDLLSISMISGNRSYEPYSLQKIMEETLQTLEYKIEQQNAVVRYDNLPETQIIPSQFRQLFQNLLSNSLKFVKEDVQPLITVTCEKLAEREVVHYQLSKAEYYYKIVFSDNGIGFENEFAGKIFAIFQRLHGRSEYEGSGIGLAICKKIVEHHGGIIHASSEPGEGATFTIILPA